MSNKQYKYGYYTNSCENLPIHMSTKMLSTFFKIIQTKKNDSTVYLSLKPGGLSLRVVFITGLA